MRPVKPKSPPVSCTVTNQPPSLKALEAYAFAAIKLRAAASEGFEADNPVSTMTMSDWIVAASSIALMRSAAMPRRSKARTSAPGSSSE